MTSKHPPVLPPELITVPETADILRVCPRTVWRLIKDGQLKTARIRRRVLVPTREIEKYMKGA